MATKLTHTCACGDAFVGEADDHAGLGTMRMQYMAFKDEHKGCGKKQGPTFTKELESLLTRVQHLEDYIWPQARITSDPGTPSWQSQIIAGNSSGTVSAGSYTIQGTAPSSHTHTWYPPNMTKEAKKVMDQALRDMYLTTPEAVPLMDPKPDPDELIKKRAEAAMERAKWLADLDKGRKRRKRMK